MENGKEENYEEAFATFNYERGKKREILEIFKYQVRSGPFNNQASVPKN